MRKAGYSKSSTNGSALAMRSSNGVAIATKAILAQRAGYRDKAQEIEHNSLNRLSRAVETEDDALRLAGIVKTVSEYRSNLQDDTTPQPQRSPQQWKALMSRMLVRYIRMHGHTTRALPSWLDVE